MSEINWLRAGVSGRAERVDREARVLYGYTVAQEGPFKSEGRGEFDMTSLKAIVEMGNAAPSGLKSRLGHPTLSDDGVGKFLGRGRDFRMGKATDARTGKAVPAVRADLHFDPSANDTPHGDLAGYVMNLAESDPDAISSSLVLEVDTEYRLEKDGTPKKGPDGEELPPLWRPKRLHASDIVDTGDAVDGLLSAPELAQALSIGLTPELSKLLRFDNVARLSTQLLDGMFRGQKREEVEKRCRGWLERYLTHRFGESKREGFACDKCSIADWQVVRLDGHSGWQCGGCGRLCESLGSPPVATPALDARRERLEDAARAVRRMGNG